MHPHKPIKPKHGNYQLAGEGFSAKGMKPLSARETDVMHLTAKKIFSGQQAPFPVMESAVKRYRQMVSEKMISEERALAEIKYILEHGHFALQRMRGNVQK